MALKCLPKDLEVLIWEYKHSADMYDIAQEFKRWFPLEHNDSESYNYSKTLYDMIAFNFRVCFYSGENHHHYIFNIFHPLGPIGSVLQPSAYLPTRLLKEFNNNYDFTEIDLNKSFEKNLQAKFRRLYITNFNL